MLRIFDVRQRMLQSYKYFIIIYITSPTRLRLEIFVELDLVQLSHLVSLRTEKLSFEYYFSEKTLPALISVLPY